MNCLLTKMLLISGSDRGKAVSIIFKLNTVAVFLADFREKKHLAQN